ncbi:MAG: hypothetical protein D6679_07885 [Candidatus Hydrogenedentota bacterium]|nr:MAG: hypothetical protein D6679_07885 [Candidatus Hydrogenedentota bacterium]
MARFNSSKNIIQCLGYRPESFLFVTARHRAAFPIFCHRESRLLNAVKSNERRIVPRHIALPSWFFPKFHFFLVFLSSYY